MVLVIIGVIVAFAQLSVGTHDAGRTAQREAERLAALLRLAQEEAVLSGRELGVAFGREGYRFMRLEDGEWVALEDDRLLRPRRFAARLELELQVAGVPAALHAGEEQAPQVQMLSSGELTPFSLRVGGGDAQGYRVRGRFDGAVAVDGPPGAV
ncbi:MAG: type II secretion system minor pseudopilin GspH [Gammaproteobacteria bacterium]|nr:type II secretion system minor pseudopilin GspH [Gammaproteobacteria bacterium]